MPKKLLKAFMFYFLQNQSKQFLTQITNKHLDLKLYFCTIKQGCFSKKTWLTIFELWIRDDNTYLKFIYIFWEGHKFLRNLHCRFVLCSNGQIYGGDFANFVAFSEYMNFNTHMLSHILKKLWNSLPLRDTKEMKKCRM